MNSNDEPSTNKANAGFHDTEAGIAGEAGVADAKHTLSCPSTSASPGAAAPPPPTTTVRYKPTHTEEDTTMKRIKLALLATTILIICMIVAISLYAALHER